MFRNAGRSLLGAFLIAASVNVPGALAAVPRDSWPAWVPRGVHLSSAGEWLLRDEIAAGRRLDAATLRRWGLDRPALETERTAPADALAAPEGTAGTVALRPDAHINDKTFDTTCADPCLNRPLGQAETTIAALGSHLVAGWNNSRGFCTGGAVQGYGYSTDGGATWIDAGDPPALPTGGRYRGDPVHAVNRKTGKFYIAGLYEGGASGSGLALARGSFSGGSFVIEDNRQIAIGGPDFLDKDWLAVDSLSGNLYVTYTRFFGSLGRIELIRSTNNGVSWDPPVVLNAPSADGLVQGSRPAVGPDGELYVAWYETGFPQSHMRIRRSDDFGLTFGPEQTAGDFYENYFSGAPGFRRAFGIALPSIAVDTSPGPYRGRVYIAWDEAVNFSDAPFTGTSPTSESEPNDFFAAATPFTVGDLLRTEMNVVGDVDLFRFSGLRGQTLFFRTDSAGMDALTMRLVCASDTSNFDNYRLLAFNQAPNAALVFTLPADGAYYLRLNAAVGTRYVIATAFDTPSFGERARDHRDRFISHSDDGATWSTPVMLNDDDPWFDGVFPEVTVDGTGAVHCFWHDFRDDPVCGAESYEYMVSSGDGGASWGPNQRISDERSYWSNNTCGSANQGDYQGITSDDHAVYPTWSDSRLGDPDVFIDRPTFRHGGVCPAPIEAPAGAPVMLTFDLQNQGNVEGHFTWSLEDDAGWLVTAVPAISGDVVLAPGGTQQVTATFNVPAPCSPNVDPVRFITGDVNVAGRTDTCTTTLHCVSATAVGTARPTLYLAAPEPNPARRGVRLRLGLSAPGPVRLEIFSGTGARVRTLLRGTQAAGERSLIWDGRDERGRAVRPGVYYIRLQAEGRSLGHPVTVVH